MTEQLARWHHIALEVRDRELQLYETNKQLRELSADQLDQPETRRRIEAQASAERMNAHRLANLTLAGEQLVKEARSQSANRRPTSSKPGLKCCKFSKIFQPIACLPLPIY